MTYKLQYRCRKCGNIVCEGDSFEEESQIDDAKHGERVLNELWDIIEDTGDWMPITFHDPCSDGGVGVMDFAGFERTTP